MRRMYSENQLIALIQQYGGQVTPEDIQEMFDDGDVSLAGKYVRIMDAPESTTLTDEQIAQIRGGIFINGSFLGFNSPILCPLQSDVNRGLIIGAKGDYGGQIRGYQIIDKVIRLAGDMPIIDIKQNSLSLTPSDNYDYGTLKLKGKKLPEYPSNTGTFTLKCVDGVLTWVADA